MCVDFTLFKNCLVFQHKNPKLAGWVVFHPMLTMGEAMSYCFAFAFQTPGKKMKNIPKDIGLLMENKSNHLINKPRRLSLPDLRVLVSTLSKRWLKPDAKMPRSSRTSRRCDAPTAPGRAKLAGERNVGRTRVV